jgi:hypothetical protein
MPISPQERKYHNTHNRNITQAEARIDGAFAEVVQGITRIYQLYDFTLPEGGAFQFEQATPAARKAADKVFANMRKRILETIQAGADAADKLSQHKAEKLTRLYGVATQLRREQTTARSLQEISDAVWKQSEQLRAEMELALSVALKSGTSADNFSREIRGYLNEPNKLFRRVRDEFGNLVLSKAAAAYHPGRGVYRSSYKNARRLAATEINMAYRKADYDRWQKLDFVIGVRIALSREHPNYDMCDELAGDYPKDFMFFGWHPYCRCIATPILQNIEDFKNGVPPEKDLLKVDKVPDNFNKWVLNNEIRINRALSGQSTMPFFLRDNKGAMEDALGRKVEIKPTNKKTALKTEREIERLIERLNEIGTTVALADTPTKETLEQLRNSNIKYRSVLRKRGNKQTPEEIVKDIAGGDKTKGSCASLALTYAARRAGLDVTDFRGGDSRSYFSVKANTRAFMLQLGGKVEEHTNDVTAANRLLKTMEEGKEYYLSTGGHAAIVRKHNGKFQYLELQSGKEGGNGFKDFTSTTLINRFRCQKSHTLYGEEYAVKSALTDITAFNKDPNFRLMMGYINTKKTEAQSGVSGRMR